MNKLFKILKYIVPIIAFNIAFTASVFATTESYCDDYFADKWNIRYSMSDRSTGPLKDIPDLQMSNITNESFSNGIDSFTSGTDSPRITLLQYTVNGSIPVGTRYGAVHPIDSSVYKIFTVRLYSSKLTVAQIVWSFESAFHNGRTTFDVYPGWHTYQIDLSTATTTSTGGNGAWTSDQINGLEFIPANSGGVDISIDWIQLVKSGCTAISESFTGTGSSATKRMVVLDSDTDFSNGIQTASTPISTSTHSIPREQAAPGTYNVLGIESGDWATLYKLNPWDFSSTADFRTDPPYISGIENISVSGGKFTGTIKAGDTDPNFYMMMSTTDRIDASVYKYLSIGIDTDHADSIRLYLFCANNSTYPVTGSTNSGANAVHIDISSACSGSTISSIRVDPYDTTTSGTFSINYIELRSDSYVNSQSTPLSTNLGVLTINDIPLDFIQPDQRGGQDFAQTVTGNSWNMNAANDFLFATNINEAKVYPHGLLPDEAGNYQEGDLYYASNATRNGDPVQYSVLENTRIDTSRWVNFCFRGWNKTEAAQPLTGKQYNSVARIIWTDPTSTDASGAKNGDDIVMTRGAQEYCFDLRKLLFAQIEPAVATNPWTSIGSGGGGGVNFFRLDMNENEEDTYWSVIDYIHLREDQTTDSQYAITVDAARNLSVELLYNSSESISGATIITTLSSSRISNTYIWNTSALANGTYYLFARVISNGNTMTREAPGRLVIDHSRTQDTTAPVLECIRPGNSYTFDNSIELTGSSVDETRISSIEAFIAPSSTPNTKSFLASLDRNKFSASIRDAYSLYADSNQAGFQKIVDTSSLTDGNYIVTITATDTGGNQSTCTQTVIRTTGAVEPSAYQFPTPSSDIVNVAQITATPTPTPTSTPIPQPSLSVSISKNTMTFRISNCVAKGKISIQSSTALLSKKPIVIGSAKSLATSAKLSALQSNQPKNFYAIVACDNKTSSVITVKATSIKSSTKTTLALLMSQIKKNFKASSK